MTKLARLFSYFGVFLSSLVCVFVLFGVYLFFLYVFSLKARKRCCGQVLLATEGRWLCLRYVLAQVRKLWTGRAIAAAMVRDR